MPPKFFHVWFESDGMENMAEPDLFECREDAEKYASLWVGGHVEEVSINGPIEAEGLIAEAEAELASEHSEGGEE